MAKEASGIDPALVRELAAILREADLGEIEVEHNDLKIRVSKPAAPVTTISHMAPAPAQAAPAQPLAPVAVDAGAPASSEASGEVIESPMVGTFYAAPSPDSDPFVQAGQSVTKDTVIGIIEAMKVMNEIKAGKDGVLTEALVENSEPVEFGQPLFKIKRG